MGLQIVAPPVINRSKTAVRAHVGRIGPIVQFVQVANGLLFDGIHVGAVVLLNFGQRPGHGFLSHDVVARSQILFVNLLVRYGQGNELVGVRQAVAVNVGHLGAGTRNAAAVQEYVLRIVGNVGFAPDPTRKALLTQVMIIVARDGQRTFVVILRITNATEFARGRYRCFHGARGGRDFGGWRWLFGFTGGVGSIVLLLLLLLLNNLVLQERRKVVPTPSNGNVARHLGGVVFAGFQFQIEHRVGIVVVERAQVLQRCHVTPVRHLMQEAPNPSLRYRVERRQRGSGIVIVQEIRHLGPLSIARVINEFVVRLQFQALFQIVQKGGFGALVLGHLPGRLVVVVVGGREFQVHAGIFLQQVLQCLPGSVVAVVTNLLQEKTEKGKER
mmetsp:Transcript_14652/g.33140  ORF Transcript_14652/g.33140 Transcript_14652/m.33140 type:complete len:386 (+) Transcript_14652:329-1486(+)